jgi:hypothetical protein
MGKRERAGGREAKRARARPPPRAALAQNEQTHDAREPGQHRPRRVRPASRCLGRQARQLGRVGGGQRGWQVASGLDDGGRRIGVGVVHAARIACVWDETGNAERGAVDARVRRRLSSRPPRGGA